MNGVILFDGECVFCDGAVQFIIKHDKKEYFQFASLQSEIGQQLLEKYDVDPTIDSVVAIVNEKAYTESDAAIEILRHFQGLWKLLLLIQFFPRKIRNIGYRFIAKNRYNWFGKKDICHLPSPAERKRYL